MPNLTELRSPPSFCEYSAGPCDQSFATQEPCKALFLYPSEPKIISSTVEEAVALLRQRDPHSIYRTWKNLPITGQLIFCEVCKALRFCDHAIVDVTTLNFNLMFEIGFAIGLDIPIIPIRDTSYIRDKRSFEELGVLDTLGYLDFQNSMSLADEIATRKPQPITLIRSELNRSAPLYVVKSHVQTDASLRVLAILKKSHIHFRTFDPMETPRLPLSDLKRQVNQSYGIVALMLSEERQGAIVHNARCAIAAGLAMASGKRVLLLSESSNSNCPIDYRDIVKTYGSLASIGDLLEPIIRSVVNNLQDRVDVKRHKGRLLEKVHFGDPAAENEIRQLKDYFVHTAQYAEVRRGNARLLIGRKGSGKTAIFYAVRNDLGDRHSLLVLDLKPEGHQFTKLREAVLDRLSPGLQEHTMVAFWHYILLCELCERVVDTDNSWAQRDPARMTRYESLKHEYRRQVSSEPGDFSERLLKQVDKLASRLGEGMTPMVAGELTERLFKGDIRAIQDVVVPYAEEKDEIWILVDNLDKSWVVKGATTVDILVLRSLLEAVRKVQQQFDRRDVRVNCVVCVRNDIYEHLLEETADRGKDPVVLLDWDDVEALAQVILQRIRHSTGLAGDFERVWRELFESHVGTEESFRYIVERTQMKPRDLIVFLRKAVEIAINRGHKKVMAEDIKKAEEAYSDEMLLTVSFEVHDVFPHAKDILYEFIACKERMSRAAAENCLVNAGLSGEELNRSIELLIWFGFFGVIDVSNDQEVYSYEVRYNIKKLMAILARGGSLVVHPCFRHALGCMA